MNDVRYAWRAIVRMPVLAVTIVASLGAGIGINTVVFSWIQARLLEPLPGVPAGRGVLLVEPRSDAGTYPGASWLEYRDLEAQLSAFQNLLAFRAVPLYVGEAGGVERVFGQLVSSNYFSALDLQPVAGRFFTSDEVARPGGEPVAVISDGLWHARFGGEPGAIGRTLRVNGRDLTIVGVAPSAFQGTVFGVNFDVWLPATLAPVIARGSRELEDRDIRGYSMMGRLRPSGTREQAQRELDAAMQRLSRSFPATNATIRAEVLAIWQSPRGPQRLLTTALAVLQGIMLLLLLAISGNTANLVLARASARQQEIGVRLALGAGPGRIVSLLLTETLMLAFFGTVLGAAVAAWGTSALRLQPLTGVPLRFQTSLDLTGLGFAALLGMSCGLIVGAAAATHLARVDPQRAIRAGTRTASRSRLRNALMGVQVALALIVLIVAGLFLRSVLETRTTDPGFKRDGVLLAAYDFAGRGVDPAQARVFADTLLQRLTALPEVESVAISSSVPLDIHGLPIRRFTIEGRARPDGGFDQAVSNIVTPDYFALMGIPLGAGRTFAPLTDVTAAPEAIVNDAFVQRYLEGAEPIGRRLRVRDRAYTIVGVMRSSLYNAFGEPPTPAVYLSYRDTPLAAGEIHLRTRRGAERALGPEVRRVVRDLDPELPVFNVRTLSDHVETNLVFRRVPARMFTVLGPLLLALVAIGIYAVVDYSSSLRTAEIGLRLAVGATAARVAAQLVGEALVVIGAGAIIGWLVALIVAMDLAAQRSIDLAVFLGVPLLLLTVAAFACWLPVRRATRIDPVAALRQE